MGEAYKNPPITSFFQLKKIPTGIYPLAVIMAGAITGASFLLYHTAVNPDVSWDRKHNPHPNLALKRNQTHKFYDPSGTQPEKWTRWNKDN
ncbi:hypothetical protein HDV04_003397 [Boothiomyces sp. JEL0838]|nr:hypothetical protein HDV04_003397 [Boothiomyces sp. JEL0838]